MVVAASAAYYFADVLRGRVRPHQASWAVWTVVGILGFGTADTAGAGPGAYAAGVDALACTATFAVSLHPRFGKPGLQRADVALGALALAAAVLWRYGPLPVAGAALLAVGCDAVGLWPTLRESWRRPQLESLGSWSADIIGTGLCVGAAAHATFVALAFPVYLLAACTATTTVLVLRRNHAPAASRDRSIDLVDSQPDRYFDQAVGSRG